MRRLLWAVLALLALPAAAQEFEVPEGFTVSQEPDIAPDDGLLPLLAVRPDEGAFAGLSVIRLARVDGEVADADVWLEGRLTPEIGDGAALDDLLDSPDSPFADPAFDTLRRALPDLFGRLKTLAKLPLEFCDPPSTGYNAAGAYRELYCAIDLGAVRQYLVWRIQKSGAQWYATEIRTMNERRLRHLLAIAATFTTGAT
jgi:hypothetical protein